MHVALLSKTVARSAASCGKLPSFAFLTYVILACSIVSTALAQEYEQEPILYSKTPPANSVSALVTSLEAGETELEFDPEFGYLRSLLRALQVPEASQTLVFSKTSLQRNRISPRTPRALFFNDDVYVGYCQQGEVLEVSAVDPQLGTVFYTVDQTERDVPLIVRQGDNCLICHGSSQTKDIPGHLVRSLFVDRSGMPIYSAGTYRVSPVTPFDERWGGWYVTGTHGAQKHLGNLVVRTGDVPREIDNASGMNLADLSDRFDVRKYPTPHSDLAALLVLVHQVDVHNAIVRANFLTRQAMHHQETLNRELGESPDHEWDSTRSRIKSACEPLVESLLCSGEAALTSPVRGTSDFAEQFAKTGPHDAQGRSLRELDLQTRLLKYPCSYLIYSASFEALPHEAKAYIGRRMREILDGADESPKFAHLSADARQAIRDILQATAPDLLAL